MCSDLSRPLFLPIAVLPLIRRLAGEIAGLLLSSGG